MKIAIVTVQVPFVRGGAEILADMLKKELIRRGHRAEIVTIPFKWYPWESLIDSMNMGRMMGLVDADGQKVDKVIALKFPAYYIQHENKVVWLLHQHRQAYDLWDTEYTDIQPLENGEEIRDFIRRCDNQYLREAKKIYTIADTPTRRLAQYNQISAETLYHPPMNYEKLHCESYGDYIFYASRIDPIKRQRLLVEAASFLKSDAKIILAGGGNVDEIDRLKTMIRERGLQDRVSMAGFITDEELWKLYGNCLGVYFGAYDEDYGYVTLEAFFAEKPVIVHRDSGGPLEFVTDGENGFVTEPDPKEIAEKIDLLYADRDLARRLGQNGRKSLEEKNMNWDYVIQKLLSDPEENQA